MMSLRVSLFLITIVSIITTNSIFAKGKSEEGIQIGISLSDQKIQRDISAEALLKYSAEYGYNSELKFAGGDQKNQNSQIEEFVNKGAKVIIVESINSDIKAALQNISNKDITVIAFNKPIWDSKNYDYLVTFNYKKAGEFQAQALIKGLNLKSSTTSKNIVLISGDPTDIISFSIYDSAMKILNPYISSKKINVVGAYPKNSLDKENFNKISIPNWNEELVRSRIERLISESGDNRIDGILSPNDAISRVVTEVLLNNENYRDKDPIPVITGNGGEVDSIQNIKDEKQFMTNFNDYRVLAQKAIELSGMILKGNRPNLEDVISTKIDNNLKMIDTIMIQPILLTKENYKALVINGYYNQDLFK